MSECRYDTGWAPGCHEGANESGFCDKHEGVKCVSCGGQASRDCCYCGQFVCGAPLCENCTDWHDGTPSTWGFLGHKHGPKADKPKDEGDDDE